MKEIYLEDNDNIHSMKFELTFTPGYLDDEDEEDDGDTYFPSESDVEGAIDNSMLDTANSYHVYQKSSTNVLEAVFIIECSNDETDEYMPCEDDIEHAMEYSGWIDEWNQFSATMKSCTIGKAVRREQKLTQLGI